MPQELDSTDQKFDIQQKEALAIIKRQVIALRNRMCSYGISSEEFIQTMQNSLGQILSKGKIRNYKNLPDLMKAINEFINRKKGMALELLTDIMSSLDRQFAEYESSSLQDELYSENNENLECNLKIEGKRSEYQDFGVLPEAINFKEESIEDERDCYVKLESMPIADIEDSIEENEPSKKKKTKGSRKKHYTSK